MSKFHVFTATCRDEYGDEWTTSVIAQCPEDALIMLDNKYHGGVTVVSIAKKR